MRKILSLFLIAALIFTAGCSLLKPSAVIEEPVAETTPAETKPAETKPAEEETDKTPDAAPEETEQEDVDPDDGFYETVAEKLYMKIQTPRTWLFLDPDKEYVSEIAERLSEGKLSSDLVEQIKDSQGLLIFFFDKANATDSFSPNFNVVGQISDGSISQKDLVGAEADAKASFERQYSEAPFENFSWIKEPRGNTLGSNFFIVWASNYTLMGKAVTGCQAVTFNYDMYYTFTYTVEQEMYTDEMFDVFVQVLETVEFID